jgi:hypothetical protein
MYGYTMRPVKENPEGSPENLAQLVKDLIGRVTQVEQELSEYKATTERHSRHEEAFDPSKTYARRHLLQVFRIGPGTLRWWVKNGLVPLVPGTRQEFYVGERVQKFLLDNPKLPPAPDVRRKKKPKAR